MTARLRIIPLPAEQVGSMTRWPWLIVIDRVDHASEPGYAVRVNREARELGAAGCLVYSEDLDLA